MKVMFVHNSLAEYRIAFWNALGKLCDMKIFVTNQELDTSIYGLEKGKLDVPAAPWSSACIEQLRQFDAVILPPADTPHEFFVCLDIIRKASPETAVFYWSETWESPKEEQPLLRRIKNNIHRQMIRYVTSRATGCIAVGKKSSEYLRGLGIDERRIKVAVDSSTSPVPKGKIDFFDRFGISDEDNVILFLGRVFERKGLKVLLTAFKRAALENTKLLVCGDGEELENCKSLVDREKIKNVIFAGKVQPHERKCYYERASVFVLPSLLSRGRIDIWGLTVNEALEMGTPVVATTAVGSAYDLVNEKTGLLVEANNVEALSEAITAIITAPEKYKKEDIICAYENNSVEHMAQAFFSAIEDCVQIM